MFEDFLLTRAGYDWLVNIQPNYRIQIIDQIINNGDWLAMECDQVTDDVMKRVNSSVEMIVAASSVTVIDPVAEDGITMDRWLEANGPFSLKEIRSLIRMVRNYKKHPEDAEGYYGVREYNGTAIVFGPKNMFNPGSEAGVEMFLQRLRKMKESLAIGTDH